MFKIFNKMPLFFPMVKTINISASSPHFNTSRFLSTTPIRNVIRSSQCLRLIQNNSDTKLQKDFEETAKNKDGLTKEEFKKALKKSLSWITDENAESIYKALNPVNPDGAPPMPKEKYIISVKEVLDYRKMMDSSTLQEGFKKHDADHDGKLNNEEAFKLLKDELRAFDKTDSKEEELKKLKKFDKDGDGKFTLEELTEFFWTAPGVHPFLNFKVTTPV